MCGIVGLYNIGDLSDTLPRALDALAHRGPDASGIYRFDGAGISVSLGHRRLSIIDLSAAANQPFVKDGLALTYNGEIYNYRELTRELTAAGIKFTTSSDTEVLLEAYRRWGVGCLARLRGMFAFAVLDVRSGKLLLARDHFGIKPLFVLRRGNGAVFASELKAIRAVLGNELNLDPTAIIASLMYYWVPESRCIFRGVTKLPAGSWTEFSPDGGVRSGTFWSPISDLDRPPAAPIDAASLGATIRASVAAHLVADVPVSCFLSGGLDSSLLAALAVDLGHRLDGYTISFRSADRRLEDMPDDLPYAKKVAARLGIALRPIEIAPDLASMLPRMVETLEEPIGDPAAINTFLICKAARQAGVKVLLSGMGADELFAGYRKHYACLLARRYQALPSWLRHGVLRPAVACLPVAGNKRGYRAFRWAKRFQSFADLPEEAGFRRSYTQYDADEFRQMLNPATLPLVEDLMEEHRRIYWEGPTDDQVNRMCLTDLRMFMPGLNLTYTDRASMAASTEVRVPYVDREVVAAAFAIPGAQKVVGRECKAILKQAAERWLPKDVIYRSKALFSAPLRAWIRRDLREPVDALLDGELVRSGFLNGGFVRSLIATDRRGIADRSKEIWQLLTLETWLQQQRLAL
jgi:asparagine synthase (glutamine-hydrolysing)